MPDKKISELTEGTPVAGDFIPYVDTAAGVTKKADFANVGSSSSDYVEEYVSGSSKDGYDSSATTVVEGNLLQLKTTGTTNNIGYLTQSAAKANFFATGKEVIWQIAIGDVFGDLTQQKTRFYILPAATGVSTLLSDTCVHVGWRLTSTADLYATSSEGANEEATDTTVNLSAVAQLTVLKLVWNPGTDCKFYVNGVLKATHSTYLPDVGSDSYGYWGIQVQTLEDAVHLYRFYSIAMKREV